MFGPKAEVTEVFSSIQGEGIFLGAKQIFVRFKRCNMYCFYCDEPRDLKAKEYSPLELTSEVKYIELSQGPHHSVVLTGGEPLLYSEFLKTFLKSLKREGLKAYLETNGTLPQELAKVIDLVDIIAMDFKLPSSTRYRGFWKEHLEFLRIAAQKKVFVKAVITPNTAKDDVKKAYSLIRKIKGDTPFILQPATPIRPKEKVVGKDILMHLLEMGSRNKIGNIRIIPQVHKMLDMK